LAKFGAAAKQAKTAHSVRENRSSSKVFQRWARPTYRAIIGGVSSAKRRAASDDDLWEEDWHFANPSRAGAASLEQAPGHADSACGQPPQHEGEPKAGVPPPGKAALTCQPYWLSLTQQIEEKKSIYQHLRSLQDG